MITQYLQSKGMTSTLLTLQDEASTKSQEGQLRKQHINRIKKAILGIRFDIMPIQY